MLFECQKQHLVVSMAGRPSKLNAQGNVIRGKCYFVSYCLFLNFLNLHKVNPHVLAFRFTISSHKMLFIKHSIYDPAHEVMVLITYAIDEGSIEPAHSLKL